jgi:hypothetical protein
LEGSDFGVTSLSAMYRIPIKYFVTVEEVLTFEPKIVTNCPWISEAENPYLSRKRQIERWSILYDIKFQHHDRPPHDQNVCPSITREISKLSFLKRVRFYVRFLKMLISYDDDVTARDATPSRNTLSKRVPSDVRDDCLTCRLRACRAAWTHVRRIPSRMFFPATVALIRENRQQEDRAWGHYNRYECATVWSTSSAGSSRSWRFTYFCLVRRKLTTQWAVDVQGFAQDLQGFLTFG